MKTFHCIPISVGLPIAFISGSLVQFGLTWYYWIKMHDIKDVYMGAIIISFGLALAVITLFPAFRRVVISPDRIMCKGIFPRNSFEIKYSECNIGIDYHCQYGRKIWWIYLCYGPPPQYKLNNKANRMNSIKIAPGFIKIMYSDEVYDALLDVLPRKQKTALETAHRFAGFDKQGRII